MITDKEFKRMAKSRAKNTALSEVDYLKQKTELLRNSLWFPADVSPGAMIADCFIILASISDKLGFSPLEINNLINDKIENE